MHFAKEHIHFLKILELPLDLEPKNEDKDEHKHHMQSQHAKVLAHWKVHIWNKQKNFARTHFISRIFRFF